MKQQAIKHVGLLVDVELYTHLELVNDILNILKSHCVRYLSSNSFINEWKRPEEC